MGRGKMSFQQRVGPDLSKIRKAKVVLLPKLAYATISQQFSSESIL